MKVVSRKRMYYKIGEWAFFEDEYGKQKTISRRIARRRIKRDTVKQIKEDSP